MRTKEICEEGNCLSTKYFYMSCPKFIIPTKVLIQNNQKYIVKYKIFISVLDDIIEKVLSSLFISEKNEEDGMNQEKDMKPKKRNLF